MKANGFIWYELMTSDMAAAADFYAAVVGWTAAPFAGSPVPYTVLNAGPNGVAGVMPLPDGMGAGSARPAWLAYIGVADVDATVRAVLAAGGAVHRQPWDMPGVGRLAVAADPQGAVFMLMTPTGPESAAADPMAPGQVGWRELCARDWPAAFDFYAGLFGWTKGDAMDMGPLGVYQLFNRDGQMYGGMMNKPEEMPVPAWLFYFTVPALDAAVATAQARGATMFETAMEVPGGWVAQGLDPQGAMFALTAARR